MIFTKLISHIKQATKKNNKIARENKQNEMKEFQLVSSKENNINENINGKQCTQRCFVFVNKNDNSETVTLPEELFKVKRTLGKPPSRTISTLLLQQN